MVLAASVLLISPCCCAGQQKERKQNEPQAQSEPAAPGNQAPAPPEEEREPDIAGGFTEIDVDRPEVTESLEYLTDLLAPRFPGYTVTDVEKAEIQIVAGYNVRLTLNYNKGGGPGTLVAKVYTDFAGNHRLLDLFVDGENVIGSTVPER